MKQRPALFAQRACDATGIQIETSLEHVGGAGIDAVGSPLATDVVERCRASDAVLFGAVGGPTWDHLDLTERPEQAILRLRTDLNCYANLRYVRSWPSLAELSPLKPEILAKGVDIVMVREITQDVYYGEPKTTTTDSAGITRAIDTAVYTSDVVERISDYAVKVAEARGGNLTIITQSNVLESSRLFRNVATSVATKSNLTFRNEIVDAASYSLITQPYAYDVILTTNQFGDILGDELGAVAGSLGLIPSVAISSDGPHLYEPIHGSAPELAGKDVANPIATMLCVALLAEHTFSNNALASAIRRAIDEVVEAGVRTKDIVTSPSDEIVACSEFSTRVNMALKRRLA